MYYNYHNLDSLKISNFKLSEIKFNETFTHPNKLYKKNKNLLTLPEESI